MACGCTDSTPCVQLCADTNTGCPVHLDFDCVFYHKDNTELSQLTSIGLANGATLNLFAETVASYISQIKVVDFVLPVLRETYTINTLKQFAEAVELELSQIKSDLNDVEALVNLPITAQDSASVDITLSGTNLHTVKADVRVSAQGGNLLSILLDGLHVAPQTIAFDAGSKELSITGGNTISLAGIGCAAEGYLGNVATDPVAPVDGNYWFNTTSGELKIKANGVVKVFTTV